MEEINLDLNNLFNLSYNFEGLKILLTSIAKNQELMMSKIRELEKNSKDNKNTLESMISGEIEIKSNTPKFINIIPKEENINENQNGNKIKINIEEKKEEEEENSFYLKDNNKDNIL